MTNENADMVRLDDAANVWGESQRNLSDAVGEIDRLRTELLRNQCGLTIRRHNIPDHMGKWVAHYGYVNGGFTETYRRTTAGALFSLARAVRKHNKI